MTLHPKITEALTGVSVDPDGLTARVGDRELVGDSPRDLRGRLAIALYDHLHARAEATRDTGRAARKGTVRDFEFEARLAAAVPHAHAPVLGVLLGVDHGEALVRTAEITLRVPRERLAGSVVPGDVGASVELRLDAARPAVSPGFFYVVGAHSRPGSRGATRRIFVHLTDAEGAVRVWERALGTLERRRADYHAKILSVPGDYPRRDALVIYLNGDHSGDGRALSDALTGDPALGAGISVFADELEPGIAAAWEPQDPRPGQAGLSFGQHRCLALARALVAHARQHHRGSLAERIADQFRLANIDPRHPDRNLVHREET